MQQIQNTTNQKRTQNTYKKIKQLKIKNNPKQSQIAKMVTIRTFLIFVKIASKMASYGRYGDDKLVHAETGELIVPKALIEGNPELKSSIFGHLREMGIEDPERYVVGSEANSLNPDTGLPEFFLKKVFKGVSKALKKAAPVVLPVALSFTPLGAVYGAALGSGLGTLLQGGDIEDALKNAVIAGGTGALSKGATGTTGCFEQGSRHQGLILDQFNQCLFQTYLSIA